MKRALIWIVAFILTLLIAHYQKVTGPTWPVKDKFSIANKQYEIVYIRSHYSTSDAKIKLILPDTTIHGKLFYHLYLLDKPYKSVDLIRSGDTLIATLPKLPPAGKYEYYIELYNQQGKTVYTRKDKPVIIRFKGYVPLYLLIPHILFMFLAIFLGVTAGLLALFDDLSYHKVQWWTLVSLLIGGFILGPLVQKYAFGQLWTGVPFGWDLTDNKTLIMLIGWIAAIWANRHESRRWWTVGAALLQVVVYLIPHSLHGSTLNPETGEVIQGFIVSVINLFT